MEVVSGHQKFTFPRIRHSLLSVTFQNNPNSINNLSKGTSMYTQVHNTKYEPKSHFPPRSSNHQTLATNAYENKVPSNDLINTLECTEKVPQLFYESNSESLEMSSSNTSSPSPTSRYVPPPGSNKLPIDNCDVSKNNKPPNMNPDLQKHIDNFRNRGTENLAKNFNAWIKPKCRSDEEKKEYLTVGLMEQDGFNSQCPKSSPESDTSYSSDSLHPKTSPCFSPKTSPKEKKLDNYKIVSENTSCHTPPSLNGPKILNPATIQNPPNLRKPGSTSAVPVPKWLLRRIKHFKSVLQECENCICFRPSVNLLCRVCGFRATSRIKRMCKVHPNTIFFTDIAQCGTCHTYSELGYFVELNF